MVVLTRFQQEITLSTAKRVHQSVESLIITANIKGKPSSRQSLHRLEDGRQQPPIFPVQGSLVPLPLAHSCGNTSSLRLEVVIASIPGMALTLTLKLTPCQCQ
jgi:hypothetical protein